MAFSLIPREEKFFDLLNELATDVHDGTALFLEICNTWTPQHPGIARIKEIQHESNMTSHEILNMLNKTFITPIDRGDIHLLAKQLNDIINNTYNTAIWMVSYGIQKSTQEMGELASILNETLTVVAKAVASIRNLQRPQRVLDYCNEIILLKNSGDLLAQKAILNLFLHETNAIEIIRWRAIYNLVEKGIDMCEDVSHTIEATVVKYG